MMSGKGCSVSSASGVGIDLVDDHSGGPICTPLACHCKRNPDGKRNRLFYRCQNRCWRPGMVTVTVADHETAGNGSEDFVGLPWMAGCPVMTVAVGETHILAAGQNERCYLAFGKADLLF